MSGGVTGESPSTGHSVPPWLVRLLAVIGAMALIAATAAAFLAYLEPEFLLDFSNSFSLCS